MFIEKLIHRHSLARIFGGLIFLLVLVSASLLDIFLPAQAQQGGSTVPTPTTSPSMTPTVSVRCGRCIVWPISDNRLDTAEGGGADLDPVKFDNLKDIPIVRSFGVADNGNILTGTNSYYLQYNWSYGPRDCSGHHEADLSTEFITSYNPAFFDSSVIDSATQYQRFLPFFQAHNPNTLIGSYYSAVSCMEDPTGPYMENYYPPNAIDCHRLVNPISGSTPISDSTPISASMMTKRWGKQCMSTVPNLSLPARLYVNVGNPKIRLSFRDNFIQTVKAIKPKPPFVFLDNVEFWNFRKGKNGGDCRLRSSAGDSDCDPDHVSRADQFGPNIYMDDFLDQYKLLLTSLQKQGIRAILNINSGANLAYPKEGLALTQQFKDILGKNGINFEFPFDPHTRETVANATAVITLYKSLLDNGNLVIFGQYADEAQSTWQAAMAMMIREPGQSLFVMRGNTPTNWISWTAQYGTPMGAATPITSPKLSVDRSDAGQHWVTSRTFLKGEITVVSFGVKENGIMTFPLSQLVPQFNKNYTVTYSSLTPDYLPTHVDLDFTTGVYTAPLSLKPKQDTYFILGADCDKNHFCAKLIAVAVYLFP